MTTSLVLLLKESASEAVLYVSLVSDGAHADGANADGPDAVNVVGAWHADGLQRREPASHAVRAWLAVGLPGWNA